MNDRSSNGPAVSPTWMAPAAAAFAAVATLLLVISASAIAAGRYPDPDDVLRMVQVRDLLGGQGWYDLTQYRIDSPGGGVAMHWSRLVDLPLAAMFLLVAPIVGPDAAETVTATAVPLVTLGCAFALVGRLAARLCGREVVAYACLALALSVPVLSHVLPMRIDHHGWQIVAALAALSAVLSGDSGRGGWLAGAALGLWLSISLEGLPMAAAISGVLALRWVRRPEDKAWFVNAMCALAGTSLLIFAGTRGWADLTNHCDALSPIHLAVFGWAAAGAVGLAWIDPRTPLARLGGLAAIAAVGATLLLTVAPGCAGGGFAGMDPLVESFWYRGVAEGQPLWRQSPGTALQILLTPLAGLWAVHALWRRAAPASARVLWFEYALLLGAALLVTGFVARAGAVAGAYTAVPLGWQIAIWLNRFRTSRTVTKAGLFAVLGAVAVVSLAWDVRFAPVGRGASSPGETAPQRVNACDVRQAAPVLRALPEGEILAPLDMGPRLLHDTRHSVVASAHHRGQAGMRLAIASFMAAPEDARRLLAKRGAAYIALCPETLDVARFQAAAPEGLLAQLVAGRRFAWLEPIPTGRDGDLKLWRIRLSSDQAGRNFSDRPFMQ